MEITETFYAPSREEWREWLEENHAKERVIWLIYYKKETGKPRVAYDHAVEEALCFGWIDGQMKGIDSEAFAQRFTPRKPKSNWSELNKERVRRLIAEGKMAEAGYAVLPNLEIVPIILARDIEAALRAEGEAWENFQNFPEAYRRVRIGFIEESRSRPEMFRQRLAYFVKMTAQNRQFGTQV